jgi:hypothetical protein
VDALFVYPVKGSVGVAPLLDGLLAWSELDVIGREFDLGGVRAVHRTKRCAATEVGPGTGPPRPAGGDHDLPDDDVAVGTALVVSAPVNRFPLEPSPRYLFIAGGIGITPIRAPMRTRNPRDCSRPAS